MEDGHGNADPLAKLNAALSLSKIMHPSNLKKNLIGLVSLAPEIEDNLLEKIELPLCTLSRELRSERRGPEIPKDRVQPARGLLS
jgi:hypothetical protein